MLEAFLFYQNTCHPSPSRQRSPIPRRLTLRGTRDPGDHQSSPPSPRSQAQPAALPASEPAAPSLLLINSMSQAAGARGQTSV